MSSSILLRRLNAVLTVVAVSLSIYLLSIPLLPYVSLWYRSHFKPPLVAANAQSNNTVTEQMPKDNTLVIPRIYVQAVVMEGLYPGTLDKGIWHRPKSSSPDNGSNTVLAAHRFTYGNAPDVFFHLDKVMLGDDIYLYWNKKKYHYIVVKTFNVAPTEVRVESPTIKPTLTMYTCTPLWTARERLVVQAELKGVSP